MNHPDAKLVDYVLGNVDAQQAEEVERMLRETDGDEQVAQLKASFEALSLSIEPVSPSAKLKRDIMAGITAAETPDYAGFVPRLSELFQLPKARILAILEAVGDYSSAAWEKTFIEGASLLHFDGGGDFVEADCGLVHLRAGIQVKEHHHLGDEWMFMLDGYVTTDEKQVLAAGDTLYSKAGSTHSLRVDSQQECLFAVVAIGGVRFL